jgi:hypothetical protein
MSKSQILEKVISIIQIIETTQEFKSFEVKISLNKNDFNDLYEFLGEEHSSDVIKLDFDDVTFVFCLDN